MAELAKIFRGTTVDREAEILGEFRYRGVSEILGEFRYQDVSEILGEFRYEQSRQGVLR